MSHLLNAARSLTPRLPLALLLVLFFCARAAQAAPQTFVSASKGDDANTCEQEKPCRTFAGALLKTDVGGEVAVLDAGEYGPFKVTHSVKVTAAGVYAGVTAYSGDAVHLEPPNGSVVALRGLTFTGKGAERGINYLAPGPARAGDEADPEAGVTLHVEGCTVSGFNNMGVAFFGKGSLFLKDTTVRGNGADGVGIHLLSGVVVRASLVNCRLEKNHNGLAISAGYAQSGAHVTLRDTVVAGNRVMGLEIYGAGVRMQLQDCVLTNNPNGLRVYHSALVALEGCMVSNSSTLGLWVSAGGRLSLSGTTVTHNEIGLYNFDANPGHVHTFANNRVFANGVNAQGKPSIVAQQF